MRLRRASLAAHQRPSYAPISPTQLVRPTATWLLHGVAHAS